MAHGPDPSDTSDPGPLAWVHDEVQRSVADATSALRRFSEAHQAARQTDLASVDDADLRMARQQLHQAVGALEMVGLGAAAQLLRGLEGAVQRFVLKPDACDQAALVAVERVSAALGDYLQRRVRQRPVADLQLFPAYRDALTLAGAERIHPADLWHFDHHGVVLAPAVLAEAAPAYGPPLRAQLDRADGYRAFRADHPEVQGELIATADYLDRVVDLIRLSGERQGFFCSSDHYALKILRHAHALGLESPARFAMMGFDGVDLLDCLDTRPTTVFYPAHDIGECAANTLYGLIHGNEQPMDRLLECPLLPGDTV